MDETEYDLMAEAETRMWWYRALHRRILDAVGDQGGARGLAVLDAGCGGGGLLARMEREFAGARLVGLDAHPRACAIAQRRSQALIAAGSINELPFPSDRFAWIVSADVLCHRAVNERRALAELLRCLCPGGRVVLNLPAFEWLRSVHDDRVHTVRRYTRKRLAGLLADAGFTTVSVSYWNSLLFPVMIARRRLFSAHGSDVMDYGPILDGALYAATAVERMLRRMRVTFPFGGSVLAIASKPA